MGTYNCVTKLAMRDYSVLWLIIEPGTEYLDESATFRIASTWEYFDDIWDFVCVEFNTGWLISVKGPWFPTGISV